LFLRTEVNETGLADAAAIAAAIAAILVLNQQMTEQVL